MQEPLRIGCSTAAELPTAADLLNFTAGGRHVVLELSGELCSPKRVRVLLEELRAQLPDHSVFLPWSNTPCITVFPVISRSMIEAEAHEFRAAIENYRTTVTALAERFHLFEPITHKRGDVASNPDWLLSFHGRHCRCENRATGQTVEVPLTGPSDLHPLEVDPFFFSEFLRTTPGYTKLRRLLRDPFHDAARVLEALNVRPRGDR